MKCWKVFVLLILFLCGCHREIIEKIDDPWTREQLKLVNASSPLIGFVGRQELIVGQIVEIEENEVSPRIWLSPAYTIIDIEKVKRRSSPHHVKGYFELWQDDCKISKANIGDWLIVRCQRGLKSNQNFVQDWRLVHEGL